MGVILYPAESSMMSHVGYDDGTRTLTILFHSGKRYDGVEREVFGERLAASSAGFCFQDAIDGCSPYRQVRGCGR